jgi:hypothetical protein
MRFRSIPVLALALACGGLSAGDVALGLSLGYKQFADTKKVNLASGSIYTNSGVTINNVAELGLDLQVVHGERFSTRWGFVTDLGQKAEISYFPYGGTEKLDRSAYGAYVMGNFNIVNGVGKNWYLTAGGVYNWYSITRNEVDLDKVSKGGVVFGTGISFNGKTMRWTPEFLIQKVDKETAAIFRLHSQFQF